MRWAWMVSVAAAMALVAATGCGDDDGDDGENRATTADGVVAVEFTSDGECTLSAGPVVTGVIDVSVTNDSDEGLAVGLLLIDQGRTLDDVQAALDAEPESLSLEVVAGVPDLSVPEFTSLSVPFDETPPGGERTDSPALTEAGEYAVACVTEAEPGVLASEALVVEG